MNLLILHNQEEAIPLFLFKDDDLDASKYYKFHELPEKHQSYLSYLLSEDNQLLFAKDSYFEIWTGIDKLDTL